LNDTDYCAKLGEKALYRIIVKERYVKEFASLIPKSKDL
jgi:hypothetical protein